MDILTDSEVRQLPVPQRLFCYADAYRNASAVMCEKMKSDAASFTWPNAAVVLWLAAHAVELFLKGALLTRNLALDVGDLGHNIQNLSEQYRSQFPEPIFEWEVPFASLLSEEEWIARMKDLNPDLTEVELKKMKASTPAPSILYRYPIAKGGKVWRGHYGFEPHSFALLLSQVEDDFSRIKSQLP